MGQALGADLLTPEEESELRRISKRKLSSFLQGYKYEPATNSDCVLVGLLLGYPIESTFSFMTQIVS